MDRRRTQEQFIEQVCALDKGFTVVGKYTSAKTPVDVQCSHGHIWSVRPTNLLSRNSGCPYCANKAVWVGDNDMWTTAPEIAKLLANPKDGYQYTKCSSEKVYFKCPDCGDISFRTISKVYKNGLKCQRCSDGISYPNKFARAFLNQLPVVNVIYEYSPKWADLYKYDNYFEYENKKYILEMDGIQHFEDVKIYKRSLESTKMIDNEKNKLAQLHGICVIRIDCSLSDVEYIKENLSQSLLNDIFDLSCIDWRICDERAQKNIAKEVCGAYSSGQHSTVELSKVFGVSRNTIEAYLKMGTAFGWCNYSRKMSDELNGRKRSCPVVAINQDGQIEHYFNGCYAEIDKIKFYYKAKNIDVKIRKSCQTRKPYKDVNFRYADEYVSKEIIDQIKLKDNAEALFFSYLIQINTQQND